MTGLKANKKERDFIDQTLDCQTNACPQQQIFCKFCIASPETCGFLAKSQRVSRFKRVHTEVHKAVYFFINKVIHRLF
jgi:hypothetical protein